MGSQSRTDQATELPPGHLQLQVERKAAVLCSSHQTLSSSPHDTSLTSDKRREGMCPPSLLISKVDFVFSWRLFQSLFTAEFDLVTIRADKRAQSLKNPRIAHNCAQLKACPFWHSCSALVSKLFSYEMLWRLKTALCQISRAHTACTLSRVQLFAASWTLPHQAPLSMGFPRQEY